MFFAPSSEGARIESFEFVESGTGETYGTIPSDAIFPFWDFTLLQVSIWADTEATIPETDILVSNGSAGVKLTDPVGDVDLPAGERLSTVFPVCPGTFRSNSDIEYCFLDPTLICYGDSRPFATLLRRKIGENTSMYQMRIVWPGSEGIMKHVKYKFLKFV